MKNIVLLTYEFTYSPFSGNGILARSLVKSFLGLGCTVTVWCCRPSLNSNDTNGNSSDNHLTPPEISLDSMERLEILSNYVPSDAWRRVDDKSCWKDFTLSNLILSENSEQKDGCLQLAISNADTICVIDWSGAVAYRSILEYQNQQQSNEMGVDDIHHPDLGLASKFYLYLNFRVFSFGVNDPKRRDWYNIMEYKAMENANVVVSLSFKDCQQLSSILQGETEITMLKRNRIPIEIIFPPLRQDMESFAKGGSTSEDFFLHLPNSIKTRIRSSDNGSGVDIRNVLFARRPIIACVARQSPEKCIQRFVKFAEMAAGVLLELNLTVVLAGAASDIKYAQKARERLLKAVPSAIIIDRFLSPKELGAVFAHTVLNFHPSYYDAYGMTIVEAAAFGAPTVVAGPSVGAFRFLGEDGCMHVDMDEADENIFSESSLDTIVKFLLECLKNDASWKRLSSVAEQKALAWDEKSYGERILHTIDSYTAIESS